MVTGIINALIDRFGCVDRSVVVMGLMPRLTSDHAQVEVLKVQNKGLFKVVRSLIRKKQYPLKFIPVHKWFMKRMKNPDGSYDMEVDKFYFELGTDVLNNHGLSHLHLLLASELNLRRIDYQWKGIPMVVKKPGKGRKVKMNDQKGTSRSVTASIGSTGEELV